MIKALAITVLTLTVNVLIELLAGWIAVPAESFLGPNRWTWLLLSSVTVLSLIALLEIPRQLPWNWWWHRFWFLMDIDRNSPWKTGSARLELGTGIRKTPGAQVIANGTRQDMVEVLYSVVLSKKAYTNRALVLGAPGSGKSTGMEQLQLKLAKKGIRHLGFFWTVPILARLGSYNGDEELFKFLERSILEHNSSRNARAIAHGIERLVEKRRVVLLFDAVDEALGQRKSIVLTRLERFLSNTSHSSIPVVLTNRTREDQGDYLQGLQVFLVQDLDDPGVRMFIRLYKQVEQSEEKVWDQLASHDLLAKHALGRNPYWLKLLIETRAFEGNKGQILNCAVDALLHNEIHKPVTARSSWVHHPEMGWETQLRESKLGLACLGYKMSVADQVECSEDFALEVLHEHLATRKCSLTAQNVLGFGRDAQILSYDRGPVRFRHRLLQEYCTALSMAKLPHAAREVRVRSGQSNWWETLVILAGLVSDAELIAVEEFTLTHDSMINAGMCEVNDAQRLLLSAALLEVSEAPGPEISQQVFGALTGNLRRGITSRHEQAVHAITTVAANELCAALAKLFKMHDAVLFSDAADLLAIMRTEKAAWTLVYGLRDWLNVHGYHQVERLKLKVIDVLASFEGAAIAPLVRIARDPACIPELGPYLQEICVESLRKMTHTSAVEPLIALLDSTARGDPLRYVTIETLGNIRDARAAGSLVRVLASEDEDQRGNDCAIHALTKIGEPVVAPLLALLNASSPTTRARISQVLVNIGTRSVGPLIAFLQSGTPLARVSAITSLGRIRDTRAVGPLQLFVDDSDRHVRRAAARALKQIGGPRAVEVQIGLLDNKDPEIRCDAAVELGRLRDSRAMEPLIRLLRIRDRDLQAAAVKGLIGLANPVAVAPLVKLLNSADTNTRRSAVTVLGNLGDARALPSLERLLHDTDNSMKNSAKAAIEMIMAKQSAGTR